jgi:hypothetical protein
MTYVIATGGIDLSVGSIMAIASAVAAVSLGRGVGVAIVLALALAGQTVLQRFFLFPAALLAVYAAHALLGWLRAPQGVARAWVVAAAVGLLALAAFVPRDVARIGDLREELRGDERLQSRLVTLANGAARPALRRCRPVYVQLGGVVPTLAYETGLGTGDMSVDLRRLARRGALVALASDAPRRLPYELPHARLTPPPYHPRRAGNRSWAIAWGCP